MSKILTKQILEKEYLINKKFKNKAQTLIKPSGKILAWGKDYFEYLIEKGI